MTQRSTRLTLFLSGLTAVAVGCASHATPAVALPGPSSSCAVVPSSTSSPESLLIATTLLIESTHVVNPTNIAERFAFAQSYETLINVSCDGRVLPGLAQSWTTDATNTRVTVVLRDGARFWDGEPLLARHVVAAWRTTAQSLGEPNDLARRLADAATVVDDRTLIVSFADTAWRVLADPSLAIYRAGTGAQRLEGSGPYRIAAWVPGTMTLAPVSSQTAPRLVIRSRPGGDARDEVDAGVDMLFSADPATVRYAASRADLATLPLPWTRTYLIVGRNAAVDWGLPTGDSAATFRAALARDAVRAEARAADSSGWWVNTSGCVTRGSNDVPQPAGPRRPARVAYHSGDHVSRELAERIVALGGRGAAVPLDSANFARALREGMESAYVMSLPRVSLDPCRDLAALLSSAPWVAAGGSISEMLMPVVDVRARAIVNRSRVSAVVEWDGTLRMNVGRL